MGAKSVVQLGTESIKIDMDGSSLKAARGESDR